VRARKTRIERSEVPGRGGVGKGTVGGREGAAKESVGVPGEREGGQDYRHGGSGARLELFEHHGRDLLWGEAARRVTPRVGRDLDHRLARGT
jgi:hypothetical protein